MHRLLLLALFSACGGGGSGAGADGGPDSGLDAGPTQWACNGYTYCPGPDGGIEHQPFSVTYCGGTQDEAEQAFRDGGSYGRLRDGGWTSSCYLNHACFNDGGGC